ncbi:MAG: sulfurtransferase TusA family protein [Acidobacteria bacterium]|nr:sulfurtransferase TusA family protein [Acidobacteriota bacterium]
MAEYKQDRVLDCTGLLCPMPVVKTNKALKELQVGQVLEMIATDPGSMPDMEAWARQTQHELLVAHQQEDGKFHFVIKKTH